MIEDGDATRMTNDEMSDDDDDDEGNVSSPLSLLTGSDPKR